MRCRSHQRLEVRTHMYFMTSFSVFYVYFGYTCTFDVQRGVSISFIAYASSPSASARPFVKYERGWKKKGIRTVSLLDILNSEAKSITIETKGGAVRFSNVQRNVGGAVYRGHGFLCVIGGEGYEKGW